MSNNMTNEATRDALVEDLDAYGDINRWIGDAVMQFAEAKANGEKYEFVNQDIVRVQVGAQRIEVSISLQPDPDKHINPGGAALELGEVEPTDPTRASVRAVGTGSSMLIHMDGGRWYFWGPDQQERFGPYPSEYIAMIKLDAYLAEKGSAHV